MKDFPIAPRVIPVFPLDPPPEIHPHFRVALCGTDLHMLQNTMHSLIYLWTQNGEAGWIYPFSMDTRYVQAYGWCKNRWVPTSILTRQIIGFF